MHHMSGLECASAAFRFVDGSWSGLWCEVNGGRRRVLGKVPVGSVKPGQGEATAGLGKEGDTGPVKVSRLVAGGVAGPVLFTLAWVISSRRQAGHCAGEVQLSGLAAEDARDPQIMMAGFVLLGVGTVMFGAGLGRVTATRAAGPWLVVAAGAASVAAGLFRRDHLLPTGPGFAGESWHNQVHDLVSGVAYGAMLAAPLILARRWRDDPDWAPVSRPVRVLALASAVTLAALTAEIVIAGRILTLPVTGVTPTREHQPTRAAETVSSLYAGRTTAVRNAGPRRRPSAHVPN
jgi:Protein of unknown function (DUF998)